MGLTAFMATSRALALSLGQTVSRRGDLFLVPSRTRAHVYHKVLLGPGGEASCTCRGYEQYGYCWAQTQVKEKYMTTQTEESMALMPIKPEPPRSILPSKQELNIIGTIAKTAVLARGHAVPASIDSAAKAAAVMLAGHELGIKPMTALRHIFVVNGRTEPDAQIMAGIVVANEPSALFEIVALTAEKCTMRFTRPSKGPNARWEYTYELADAKTAGLLNKDGPWKQYPKDMMRWAATKRLCRVYAPDLINNVGAVVVNAISDLLAAAEDEPTEVVDVEQLPDGVLYNEGDEPAPEPQEEEPELLSLDDARVAITDLLTPLAGTPNQLTVMKPLARFMPDGKSSFNPDGLLDEKTANEALAAARQAVAALAAM